MQADGYRRQKFLEQADNTHTLLKSISNFKES